MARYDSFLHNVKLGKDPLVWQAYMWRDALARGVPALSQAAARHDMEVAALAELVDMQAPTTFISTIHAASLRSLALKGNALRPFVGRHNVTRRRYDLRAGRPLRNALSLSYL